MVVTRQLSPEGRPAGAATKTAVTRPLPGAAPCHALAGGSNPDRRPTSLGLQSPDSTAPSPAECGSTSWPCDPGKITQRKQWAARFHHSQ